LTLSPRGREALRVAQLRDVDGLDLDEALLRVPTQALLEELLVEFERRWADGAARIAGALSSLRRDEAERLAHALAGVAGTLALVEVADRARRVELLLDAGNDESAATEVAALRLALDRATSSIRRVLGGS
jgi:HPt (histidine-containing phosphotransfer) domain-containing protein